MNMLLTLLVEKIGLLAAPTGAAISNVMPTPIGMAFTNASWTGAVWAIVLIALNTVIWIPFLRAVDQRALEAEKSNAAVEE